MEVNYFIDLDEMSDIESQTIVMLQYEAEIEIHRLLGIAGANQDAIDRCGTRILIWSTLYKAMDGMAT